MTTDELEFVIHLFERLRLHLGLGVGELLAALRALDGGWGKGEREDLKQMLTLIWCHSREMPVEFEEAWAEKVTEIDEVEDTRRPIHEPDSTEASTKGLTTPNDWTEADFANAPRVESADDRIVTWPAVPVLPIDVSAIQPTWPAPRRAMVYAWRRLRRNVADGPRTEADISATINMAARQGCFLEPVLHRREHNDAHLVLLIDRNGSMVPFHQFTRDLAETARDESGIEQLDVLYFHNVPQNRVYLDPYLTVPMPLESLLGRCLSDTYVALISDAGAARGRWQLERIRPTAEFLVRLRQRTSLMVWLNPMAQRRWHGTSAQVIAYIVSMFPLTSDGLANAVDVLRGQPVTRDLVL